MLELRLPTMMDDTLDFLKKRYPNNRNEYEIIIVDDGSKDQTTSVALQYSKVQLTFGTFMRMLIHVSDVLPECSPRSNVATESGQRRCRSAGNVYSFPLRLFDLLASQCRVCCTPEDSTSFSSMRTVLVKLVT